MKSLLFLLTILALSGIALAQEVTPPAPAPPYPPLTEDAKVIGNVAIKAFDDGDLAAARLQFEKMRALCPDHPMPLINLGTIEFRTGRLKEGAKRLQEAIKIDPQNAEAWTLLGMVRVYQEQPNEALAALSQALLLNPSNPKIHNYLGVAIGKKRWFDGAESELQEAIRLDPKYADAHFNLCLMFLQRDPPEKALAAKHYQDAIKLGALPDADIEQKLKK